MTEASREPDTSPDAAPTGEGPGGTIGPYTLLEVIGEGGMGTVYLAEQTEPIRRQVALKVVKLGMDTKEVLARFEVERRSLALMDHENIARVLDAGMTERGRPFFVMEHVAGPPITEYCDREQLPSSRRIGLFLQVCEAVQHAHQKGILHRDIKPTNVLVAERNGEPVPKVIDFGLARAMDRSPTEGTVYTSHGQIIGTIEYMSPEQATMSDVDARSDIYSLGVLLYEILTGVLPFDRKRLQRAGLSEILRVIREDDPPRPSTRVSSLGAEASRVADHRQTDLRALRRRLRGDLDWITMKALEKQRLRRYDSASELAADLKRHLADQPVLAGPPSAAYRMRKFVRRHRAIVAAGALVVLALAAGVVGTTLALLEARSQRDEARAAHGAAMAAEATARREKEAADGARDAEALARRRAETEAERARAVTDFLKDIIGLANPDVTQTPDLTMREALDRAAQEVGDRFGDQPGAEATVREVIGQAYATLGKLEEARDELLRAAELHADVLGSDARTRYAIVRTLQRLSRDLGMPDQVVLWRQGSLLTLEIVESAHPGLASALRGISKANENGFDLAAARRAWRDLEAAEAEALGPGDPLCLVVADSLEASALRCGHAATAQAYLRHVIALRKRLLPEKHTSVSRSRFALIESLRQSGPLEEAEAEARETIASLASTLGEEHWYVAHARTVLGSILLDRDRLEEAKGIVVPSYARLRDSQGPTNRLALRAEDLLVTVYDRIGDREAAGRTRRSLAAHASSSYSVWWPCYRALGREDEELHRRAKAFDRALHAANPDDAQIERTFDELVEARGRLLAPDDPRHGALSRLLSDWVNLYVGIGGRSELIIRISDAVLADVPGNRQLHGHYRGRGHYWRSLALGRLGRHEEALADVLEARRVLTAWKDHSRDFAAVMATGAGTYLMQLGRLDEAAPLLRHGYERLVDLLGPENGNTVNALDALTRCYRRLSEDGTSPLAAEAREFLAGVTARGKPR